MNYIKILIIAFLISGFNIYGAVDYTVSFTGIDKNELLESLKKASNSVALQSHPPKTLTGLKQRAEGDVANLVKVLHSQALYNAKVDVAIDPAKKPVLVVYMIQPGPVYPLRSVEIYPKSFSYSAESIGLKPGTPATPKKILAAEGNLLQKLHEKGYPYAQVTKKEVIADQSTKSVSVLFSLDPGHPATFGPVTIKGNRNVLNAYIMRKIQWREGGAFDPKKIESTVNALTASGLFSHVLITYPDEPTPNESLPMIIEVDEAKHRSLALGLSYSTQRGPGFTVEWANRNIGGKGNRLFFDANVLELVQEATLEYVIPEFLAPNQDLIWTLEAEHDDTEGFKDSWVSVSGRIERKLNQYINYSYGLQYKQLWVSDSDNDGTYGLLKTPFHWRWSNANDSLDPTKGYTFYSKIIPTLDVSEDPFWYGIGHFSISSYQPVFNNRFILAARAQLGTIIGSSRKEIPASERLYAGSETTLRGYNYYTVSPLDKNNEPEGGRSLFSLFIRSPLENE